MADRLAELLRQRALLQEHLEWLDAEIAAASGPQAPKIQPIPSATASATVATQILAAAAPRHSPPANPQSAFRSKTDPLVTGATETVGGAGDEILDQYRSSPDSLKTDVRKGCFLYFAAAFVILGLGVAALWFAFRSRHPDGTNEPPRMERGP